MASGSAGVVIAAMFANGGIAILKFGGFIVTGSPSMLAETYHSISDTGNQVLLLFGIKYSQQKATRIHPFGYGKAQFFYAFLVSVLLFAVAGWESLKHGVEVFRHGTEPVEEGSAELLGMTIEITLPVDPYWIAVVILFAAIGFELYALKKANSELRRQMREYGWSNYREVFNRTSDVPTLTAFTEDIVALLGLVTALFGIVSTRITGNHLFDALGAIIIGVLLMVFAFALAVENKRLILGESLQKDVERRLHQGITDHHSVKHVDEFRSMFIGAGQVLVTADVSFNEDLSMREINDAITAIEANLREMDTRVEIVYIEPEV